MYYLNHAWYGFNISAGNIEISITSYCFIENTVNFFVMFSVLLATTSRDIKKSFSAQLSYRIFMFIIWEISIALSVIVLISSLINYWPQLHSMNFRVTVFAFYLYLGIFPLILYILMNGICHFLLIYREFHEVSLYIKKTLPAFLFTQGIFIKKYFRFQIRHEKIMDIIGKRLKWFDDYFLDAVLSLIFFSGLFVFLSAIWQFFESSSTDIYVRDILFLFVAVPCFLLKIMQGKYPS